MLLHNFNFNIITKLSKRFLIRTIHNSVVLLNNNEKDDSTNFGFETVKASEKAAKGM